MRTRKIAELGAGSRFTYGNATWVILERNALATLCFAADVLEYRAFDDDNNNNFAASSLRSYLNGEFLQKLMLISTGFVPIVIDLTADDGTNGYGRDRAKIALMTCDMYRRYRDVISVIAKQWWLATADSTQNNFVRHVHTDGTLSGNYAYYGNRGVRPLCCLKSETVVFCNPPAAQAGKGRTMTTRTITDYIPEGRKNAITRQRLCEITGLPDRSVRAEIEQARRRGVIIVNAQDGAGYYQSKDIRDVARQFRQNERRALSILSQQKHLRRILKSAGALQGNKVVLDDD